VALKKIGIPFEFNDNNYKAIFLGQLELYNEWLECFKMQLTPAYIESEKNLEELKIDLITTIDTVWEKCCSAGEILQPIPGDMRLQISIGTTID
jgi:hypothetical protein